MGPRGLEWGKQHVDVGFIWQMVFLGEVMADMRKDHISPWTRYDDDEMSTFFRVCDKQHYH